MAQAAKAAHTAGNTGAAELITAVARHIALLAAVIATCGSLFFSEVLGWLPCELCWYQRILMYPLTVILTVGILRDDRQLHWYVLPLSLTGMAVSLYHFLLVLQVLPPPACAGVPCSIDYLAPYFTGPLAFIRIPSLAFAAFTIISVMMGNYAIAGAPGFAEAHRRSARGAAIAIVVGVVVLFVGLALAR
jgi:disulfide bond formation protein DsbB